MAELNVGVPVIGYEVVDIALENYWMYTDTTGG
jgi:hypothetical protein